MGLAADARLYNAAMPYKQPFSVLVVIHTADLHVLLLERKDYPGTWQSVTGSRENNEALPEVAAREVFEETGITVAQFGLQDWQQQNVYEIFERWRHRYAPGVTHNTEHVFSVQVPTDIPVTLAPAEHTRFCWMPWQQAADAVFSPSNAAAIRALIGRKKESPLPK
ncbi:Dihydroneopterin triphosphate pyrophosphatase [Amantichitinum ursilacus]|uniref:Dihydroneopterin triphosphate pyrophosphatase n=2 Tax=Amantichitinum ursilacus TaxID=857265 RepID=A0A0N0GR85_9NEIS|nr:Dihydroneopterin triphosphate pyrophosphatase [Amantichitinum ursilacus]